MRWLAAMVRRERITAEELVALKPERILVVRQHNQMGDMVCATPALRAIGQSYPGARLALVTSPVNDDVVRCHPQVHRVLTFDRGISRLPLFLRAVRGWRPDLAIVLSSVSFSLTSALIGLASGARYVVGVESKPFGWDFSARCFSLEMPGTPAMDRHAIAHGLAPLQAVGITTDDTSTVIVPSTAEVARAEAIRGELALGTGYWAMHPGAGKRQNVWPPERFLALALRAAGEGRDILVLHGPADAAAVAMIKAAGLPTLGSIRVAPPCSVGVAAALLEEADRFLCNDTGIMHVAGAVRTPTVALFGPTEPALWKPPADEVVALKSSARLDDPRGPEFGWMETLDEETVWRAWSGLVGRAAQRRDG